MTVRISAMLVIWMALIVPISSLAVLPADSVPSPDASSAMTPFQQQLVDRLTGWIAQRRPYVASVSYHEP